MRRRDIALLAAVLLVMVLACGPSSPTPGITPAPTWTLRLVMPTPLPATPVPDLPTVPSPDTPTAQPVLTRTPTPTSTPEPQDTGWRPVAPGVEARQLDVTVEYGMERVLIVRIEPDAVQWGVAYQPDRALQVGSWAQQTGALLTVNAGYFTPEYQATGLLVSDGKAYGTSYGDFAGMFAVTRDGQASVRWLRLEPYNPWEALHAAVQSFPLLVKPGGVVGFPADADEGGVARRTVVAQDQRGRILFLVASRGLFNLHELAVWLAGSDLDLDIAVNLDGGPSSGIYVGSEVRFDSLMPVPAVILVHSAGSVP